MNASVSAVLRGNAAIAEVIDLLTSVANVDDQIESVKAQTENYFMLLDGLAINNDEVIEMLNRRRDGFLTKLENKGIRIAPEPTQGA